MVVVIFLGCQRTRAPGGSRTSQEEETRRSAEDAGGMSPEPMEESQRAREGVHNPRGMDSKGGKRWGRTRGCRFYPREARGPGERVRPTYPERRKPGVRGVEEGRAEGSPLRRENGQKTGTYQERMLG
ncbi:hypothetical protein AMTR_s00034p00229240 [Amborella trichopoda]|uniref:Uncharacterized protein n=1 Tax=Amborella trichopoda TaxID=13333 RepID=W1PXT2_AMBTC|nr:hypothetical protein AMTR_s00034p00229240 [Amborella trichopoda]